MLEDVILDDEGYVISIPNEYRFREVQCLKCKSIGLLSSGLCRVPDCGCQHKVVIDGQ